MSQRTFGEPMWFLTNHLARLDHSNGLRPYTEMRYSACARERERVRRRENDTHTHTEREVVRVRLRARERQQRTHQLVLALLQIADDLQGGQWREPV